MKKNYKNNAAFTLIELIIVITIIAILGATIISFINPFEIQKNSRDSIRVSTLSSIAQALELYFATNKNYPDDLTEAKSVLPEFNSRISWEDPSESCEVSYRKTNTGYELYLPKESESFQVPSGQSLISIIDTPSGYRCGSLSINGLIKIEVK
jgi:prepilin-type N-terminal cleavage/methylation domain-containing protein